MARILLIDDEGGMLDVLSCVLREAGNHDVTATMNGNEAVDLLKSQDFDLMITDIRMAPINGMDLLRLAHKERPALAVIIITAFSSMETAMEAYTLGVFDYFLKPFKVNELLEATDRAIEWKKEHSENGGMEFKISTDYYFGAIIAKSKTMQDVCDMIRRVAPTDMSVLISGPAGSGKKQLAKTIHGHSPRKQKKLLSIDCGDESGSLEETIFGNAARSDKSTIDKANGGTIFLESVENLTPSAQERFVEVIKEKHFRKPGSSTPVPVNVRVIASTGKDLDNWSRRGVFRNDFYHVLTAVDLTIPPLNERPEDILPLACIFLEKEKADGEAPKKLGADVCNVLRSYSWPGNADELREAMRSAVSLCQSGVIEKQYLPGNIISAHEKLGKKAVALLAEETTRCRHLKKFIQEKKRAMLQKVIKESDGDKKRAATVLNISLADLNRRLGTA